jgi:hypothetical protein
MYHKAFDANFFDDAVGPLSPAAFVTALRKDSTIECYHGPVHLDVVAPDRKQVEIARDSGFNDFIAVPERQHGQKPVHLSVLTAPKQFISSLGAGFSRVAGRWMIRPARSAARRYRPRQREQRSED